ncbi:hypothetical protein GCM10027167_00550 [Nocardia heshunensis]
MAWDSWALLSIAILCGGVILWSWWGFRTQLGPADLPTLRLTIIGGGYVEVPNPSGYPSGRHRLMPTHRA